MNGADGPPSMERLSTSEYTNPERAPSAYRPNNVETLAADRPEHRPVRHEGGDQQREHRQPGRTRHQRGRHHRGEPMPLVRDRAGRHDAGHRARERRQHGDEAAAFEPETAHHPVGQQRCSGHVADSFEQADDQEQQGDLRQEHEHAADPTDHAVGQELTERSTDSVANRVGERADDALEQVDDRRGQGEDRLEERQHDGDEHERTRRPGATARRRSGCVRASTSSGFTTEATIESTHAVRCARLSGGLMTGRCQASAVGDQRPHRVEPDTLVADHADHGDAQRGRQSIDVDRAVSYRDFIDHRQHEAGRQVEFEELGDQEQRAVERCRVGDHDQRVGRDRRRRRVRAVHRPRRPRRG